VTSAEELHREAVTAEAEDVAHEMRQEIRARVIAAVDALWADLGRVLAPEQVAALNEHYGAVELALDP
jgi:hypothetical protein